MFFYDYSRNLFVHGLFYLRCYFVGSCCCQQLGVLVLRCRQNDQIVNFNAISLIYAHDEFLMMFSRPNFDKRYILMLHTFILNSHIECGCHMYFYSSYNYKDIFFISAIRISFLHSSTFSLFVLSFFSFFLNIYAPVVKIME